MRKREEIEYPRPLTRLELVSVIVATIILCLSAFWSLVLYGSVTHAWWTHPNWWWGGGP